jgi:hypothetical protein
MHIITGLTFLTALSRMYSKCRLRFTGLVNGKWSMVNRTLPVSSHYRAVLLGSIDHSPLTIHANYKMSHIKTIYKFLIVILVGLLIFLADLFELASPIANEVVLFAICIFKASYFIRFVFRQIKATAYKEFSFHEFMSFVVTTILLVIVSYAIDYYCLFRIDPDAFAGIIHRNIGTEVVSFFYFSISVFTTAGFGDIKPNLTTAQILVSTELMIAYFFTILVLANILLLRESFKKRDIP